MLSKTGGKHADAFLECMTDFWRDPVPTPPLCDFSKSTATAGNTACGKAHYLELWAFFGRVPWGNPRFSPWNLDSPKGKKECQHQQKQNKLGSRPFPWQTLPKSAQST